MNMQQPRSVKFRKVHRVKLGGHRRGGVQMGWWGLVALEPGRVSARQLEAVRRVVRRRLGRQGRRWRVAFPAIPVTGKPAEVRRGKGKGAVEWWSAAVRSGTVLLEVGDGVESQVRGALKSAGAKLGIATAVVKRPAGLR